MKLSGDDRKRRARDRLLVELLELPMLGRISAAAQQFARLISGIACALQVDPDCGGSSLYIVAEGDALFFAVEVVLPEPPL